MLITAWHDYVVMLQTLSWSRISNMLRVVGSYFYSRLSRQATISGLPMSLAIEPTTSCNLRCPECPSGLRSFSRPTGMLDQSMYERLMDEVSETAFYLTFYFQGEPYLHPRFLDMVRYASQKKIYTATSTNAHYLSDEQARKTVESGLSRLIISLDGTSQESYAAYRIGGQLEKVIEGTKRVIEWKKKLGSMTPYLVFQFLVVRHNEHEIKEAKRLARKLGVDQIVFKTAQIYDYQLGSDLIPIQEKYSRYEQHPDGNWQIKNKWLNHCWKMWHSCVVTWDGKVVPCCFDKDAQHSMGTVLDQPLAQIWNSVPYQNFRASLLKSRSEIDMCKNCTEGSTVFA